MGLWVALLALLAVDSGSRCCAVPDCVDRIELNHHVCPRTGEMILDQIIFWDYSPAQSCFVVRGWRSHKSFAQTPYHVGPSLYRTCWHDARDSNAMRVVTAGSFVETFTDYDPEIVNGEAFDRNCRKDLAPKVKRGRR